MDINGIIVKIYAVYHARTNGGMENMITMVLSVYNTGQYLPKAIDTVLCQTCGDFEVILVDDGSTDGSAAVCDEQAARSEKIRVFHKPNGGLSSARNFGIEHAKGDFIIFPDPDDWLEPGYLEGLVAIRQKHNADLSVCGHYFFENGCDHLWNANGSEEVFGTVQALDRLMQPASFCGYAWNKLYSMEVIRRHGLRFDTELGMAQDLHFAFRYLRLCSRVAYDPQLPLYHYNRDTVGVTTYDTPLTPRKISGLKTYVKIAALAHGEYPSVEAEALGVLSDTALQYIYLYYHFKTKEPQTLALLRGYQKQYFSYFLASPSYSAQRKLLGRIARVSPRLYYAMFQSKRVLFDTARRLTGRQRKI